MISASLYLSPPSLCTPNTTQMIAMYHISIMTLYTYPATDGMATSLARTHLYQTTLKDSRRQDSDTKQRIVYQNTPRTTIHTPTGLIRRNKAETQLGEKRTNRHLVCPSSDQKWSWSLSLTSNLDQVKLNTLSRSGNS